VPEGDTDINTGSGCIVMVEEKEDIDKVKDIDLSSGDNKGAKEEVNKATSIKQEETGSKNQIIEKQEINVVEENWQEVVFEFENNTYYAAKDALDYIRENKFDIKSF